MKVLAFKIDQRFSPCQSFVAIWVVYQYFNVAKENCIKVVSRCQFDWKILYLCIKWLVFTNSLSLLCLLSHPKFLLVKSWCWKIIENSFGFRSKVLVSMATNMSAHLWPMKSVYGWKHWTQNHICRALVGFRLWASEACCARCCGNLIRNENWFPLELLQDTAAHLLMLFFHNSS